MHLSAGKLLDLSSRKISWTAMWRMSSDKGQALAKGSWFEPEQVVTLTEGNKNMPWADNPGRRRKRQMNVSWEGWEVGGGRGEVMRRSYIQVTGEV